MFQIEAENNSDIETSDGLLVGYILEAAASQDGQLYPGAWRSQCGGGVREESEGGVKEESE